MFKCECYDCGAIEEIKYNRIGKKCDKCNGRLMPINEYNPKKYVLCIDDLVDGLTMYKIYEVKYIKINYFNESRIDIIDDYGIYNTYFANRFIFVDDRLISNIIDFKNKM